MIGGIFDAAKKQGLEFDCRTAPATMLWQVKSNPSKPAAKRRIGNAMLAEHDHSVLECVSSLRLQRCSTRPKLNCDIHVLAAA